MPQTKISLTRQTFSLLFGLLLIGLGVLSGVIPLYRIVTLIIAGGTIQGNWGLPAFSVSLIPLGVWIIITVFQHQKRDNHKIN